MNQPLTRLDEKRQAIEARVDTARTSELAFNGDGGGLVFRNVSEAMEAAKLMALSDKAVRPHLRNNPGACFGIVIQAVEWGMSPYSVANKSYLVNDQFAYESQLIQAVILRRAPIKGRIRFSYEGEGDQRVCIASATDIEGEVVEYRTPALGKITPKNSPLWKNDPDQQMAYMAGRNLCRRHFPDVLLGIYDRDELDGAESIKDVTPQQGTGLAARLQGAQGGFNAQTIESTLEEAQERQEPSEGTDALAEEESQPAAISVDWNNAEEATKALDAGLLPDGFSVNEFGALVIPDELHGKKGQPRGHSIIAASFEEIVTTSGVVVKSKAPPPADDDFPGDLPFEGDE